MSATAKRLKASRLQSAAFHRTRTDHQSELTEDYVELIADLIDERGEARCTDIAMRLGVANATVVKTLKRLQAAELITQEPYRAIFLTVEGWKMAEDGRRKHAIVEKFLLALGVSQETARIDSEGIEHHVSTETLRAMGKFLARNGG
jgi:DtxR family manganese transport transcriptional regulator